MSERITQDDRRPQRRRRPILDLLFEGGCTAAFLALLAAALQAAWVALR